MANRGKKAHDDVNQERGIFPFIYLVHFLCASGPLLALLREMLSSDLSRSTDSALL